MFKTVLAYLAKKKARSGAKETRNPVASANRIDEKISPNIETHDDAVSVVNDRKGCPHVDKVIDVDKVSAKLKSSKPVRCEDCKEGVADRQASRTKVCGHFSCGGVGLPTTPQSHAVRHARQYHHPLAVQFENPQLRWCFLCNTLLHAKRVEDGSEQKEVLEDIAKMIKRRPSEGPTTDVEAVWFGSGSVTSEIKSEASASISADGKGGCAIRGLVNLGYTCFFNSIMQNLLAMNRLRDYFLKFDGFAGPLTTYLKQLFTDTSNEALLKESVNPKSLFGSLCTKAPQFRGYQQQDSHELLRCLLDRLCTEELTHRKQIKSSQDGGKSLSSCPTFVDEIFGGRLSSTVSCLECGHTSVVYEPFLDLSLPVPTKKPPSKGAQSVSHAKMSKPPKRSGKVLPKVSRDAASLNSQGNGEKSLSHVHPRVPVTEGMILPSDTSLESNDAGVMADNMGLTSQDSCFTQKSRNEETCEASEVDHILTNQGPETGSVQPVDPLQNNLDADTEMKLTCTDSTRSPNDLMCLDDQGQSKSPDCDLASEFSKTLLLKESGKISSVDSNLGTDSCTRLSEDEAPLQLQESEILLLPYKEVTSTAGDMLKEGCEVSSAAVGWEEDSLDLDGVGDLFNEPESDAQSLCNAAVSQANGMSEASFTVSNISVSDPEDLDNTDAPVSVKSCLAYFTKPELLSKSEHAWQCENCTKEHLFRLD
ncbi:hypothetical protein RDI58_014008 [Solanum bulbocastanum]|uniref:Ubiquitinyl hydrolase 1 n=1 Tax=Solanum bulbocastanum TaxID=147425 RepID=A0AAN8TT05_SOLBU